jgi:hypothetical protein
MPHRRKTICLAIAATLALATSPALADRAPTKSERSAIKRAATKECRLDCEFRKARVSTRNARYAWADVIGEGISGVLLKRRRPHSRRFKVIGFQGGGIGECSYWRKRAPRKVLRDLDVSGLVGGTDTRRCG